MNGCDDGDADSAYPTPVNYNDSSMGGFLTYAEMLQVLDNIYAYS